MGFRHPGLPGGPPALAAGAGARLGAGGTWSYSLYLWHGLLLYVVQHYLGFWRPTGSVALDALFNFALLLPAALALAALSYATIERPFLRMRGRYVRAQGREAQG